MPRAGLAALAVTFAVGLGVVLGRAGSSDAPVAFTVGPGPALDAALVPARAEACQTPLEVLADSDSAGFWVRSGARPGPALDVTVRDGRGRLVARHRVAGGYPSGALRAVAFRRLHAGEAVSLCIRNRGSYPITLAGGDSVPGTGTVVAGRSGPVDLSLVFARERPPSILSLVPTMFRHAALFRFGWVGSWTYWVVAALVVLAVPLLCGLALRAAARESG